MAGGAGLVSAQTQEKHGIFGILGGFVFVLALAATLGVFGYKWYLNKSIGDRSSELDTNSATLNLGSIKDLTRLDARITLTKSLLESHVAISPIFDFLEKTTPKTVRFNDFDFSSTPDKGIVLTIKGLARSYTNVAFESDVLEGTNLLSNVLFSDLSLDDKGNVNFTVTATVPPGTISYKNEIVSTLPTTVTLPSIPKATGLATSTATTTATSTTKKK